MYPLGTRRLIGPLGNGVGGGEAVNIFWDNFTTPEAALLVSPRAAEPGPGTLTCHQDTNSSISIAANKTLYFNSSLVASNNGYKTGDLAHSPGQAAIARHLNQVGSAIPISGFRRSTTLNQLGACFLGIVSTGQVITITTTAAGTSTIVWVGGSNVNANKGDYWVVQRSAGAFYIWTYKDIAKLIWVDNSALTIPVVAGFHVNGTARGGNVDSLTVKQLGAPWITDWGVATSYLTGARSSGDAFTHASNNFLLYFVCTTLPASGEHDIRFRIQDGSNYWKITIDSAGAIKLFEVVATVATQRGSTYTGVANGNRIGVVCQGAEIDVSVIQTRRITYATAATFLTATDGKIETVGTSGSISELETYPRDLTGANLTTLGAPSWDTFVAYGDSVTQGFMATPGFGDAVSSWLKAYYQNSGTGGISLQNTVQNTVAPTGQALANNMRDNYTAKVLDYDPRYVLLMGGLNDLRFSDAAFSSANFQTDLGEIVDAIIADGIPASRIIICSPPYMNPANYGDSSPYNAGTTPKHVAYVAAAAAVASSKGTIYVDVYQAMLNEADPTALMQADGTHPLAAGHTVIANAIIAAIGGTLA